MTHSLCFFANIQALSAPHRPKARSTRLCLSNLLLRTSVKKTTKRSRQVMEEYQTQLSPPCPPNARRSRRTDDCEVALCTTREPLRVEKNLVRATRIVRAASRRSAARVRSAAFQSMRCASSRVAACLNPRAGIFPSRTRRLNALYASTVAPHHTTVRFVRRAICRKPCDSSC